MRWTEKEMCKHFGHIEDHQYKHFNQALGVKIESKEHFRSLLEKGNYIPYEESCKQVNRNIEKQKYSGISQKAENFCRDVGKVAKKDGKVEWTSTLIDGMKKEVGLDYSYYKTLPKHFQVNLDTKQGGN